MPETRYREDTQVLEQIETWLESGHRAALATVIETWGSAPRPAGSQLGIAETGAFTGSVSGGCIEGDVVTRALDIIQNGQPEVLEYGIADARAWEVGLACGGHIRVFVEPVETQSRRLLIHRLLQASHQRRPVALLTKLPDGMQKIIEPTEKQKEKWILPVVSEALKADSSRIVENAEGTWFLKTWNPPLRLFIVGAVHIAQPLASMALLAGYDVTLIDPREAFASAARFPEMTLCDAWPDEALEAFAPDSRTAIVTLTHDPKLDDPALCTALATPCFYIGALGSRKTHAARLERLEKKGYTAQQLARIHGPAGLPLGGRKPSEIAVSILAQITETLHR